MIVTLTVDRRGSVRSGQVRSRAANADAIPFQATLRRFSTSRRPSSLAIEIEADRVDPELRAASRPARAASRSGASTRAPRRGAGGRTAPPAPEARPRCPGDSSHSSSVTWTSGESSAVVEVGVAHARSDPALDMDLGAVGRQEPDEGRQEVAPLACLPVHPWKADGHPMRAGHDDPPGPLGLGAPLSPRRVRPRPVRVGQ